MTGSHPTPTELEHYVMGALGVDHCERLEAHCGECDGCAAALAQEARLELAFERVARRSIRSRRGRPVRAAGYGAAGLLAVAAATFLWVGRTSATTAAAGERMGTARRYAVDDAAILDAQNDALDGG